MSDLHVVHLQLGAPGAPRPLEINRNKQTNIFIGGRPGEEGRLERKGENKVPALPVWSRGPFPSPAATPTTPTPSSVPKCPPPITTVKRKL